MADRRAKFREDIAAVAADAQKSSDDLFRRLEAMSPREFLQQPLRELTLLTVEQYKEIVATIASKPEPKLPVPSQPPKQAISPLRNPPGAPTPARPQSGKMAAALAEKPRKPTQKTQTIGEGPRRFQLRHLYLVIGILLLIAGVSTWFISLRPMVRDELVRSRTTASWPACNHLDEHADGCLYILKDDADWQWAAERLQIPIAALQHVNRHLDPQLIHGGSTLIIWRNRGRVED